MTTSETRRTITYTTNPTDSAERKALAPGPQSLAPASPVPQSLRPLVSAHRDSNHSEHKFPLFRCAIA
jgi:hypothetical protein